MNDFLPPILMPGYCGHLPTIAKTAFGNTYGGATKKFFLDYRHQILTNSAVSYVHQKLEILLVV